MAYNYDINFTKGDTIRWTQFFKNSDGSTFNFSGSTLYMNVRNSYSSGNTVVSYRNYISGSCTPSQPNGYTGGLAGFSGGTLYICIGSTYSNKLKTERTGTYEIKVVSSTKNTNTILKGNLYPIQNVTPDYTSLVTPTPPPPPFNVVASFLDAGITYSNIATWQTEMYELAVDELVENNIGSVWVMYEAPYSTAIGCGADGNINSALFNSVLQGQLLNWSANNTSYGGWYGEYPYHLYLDFENQLTIPFINNWQNTGITAMNELIQCFNLTKQQSPNSVVYEYDTPYIPLYVGNQNILALNGTGSTYTALINQFVDKVNYLKNDTDIFDISAYCPFYADPNDYKPPYYTGNTANIALYEYWNQLRFDTLVDTLGSAENAQITMSFVLYPGVDNGVPYPSTAQDAANLGNLVFSNQFINQYAFTPAKNAGVSKLLLWEGWPYRIDVTQYPPGTEVIETYIQRKTMNDLFKDLNPGDTGFGLTASNAWRNYNTVMKMWDAVLTKTIQLSDLFKQN
jgi:hypothetical protein